MIFLFICRFPCSDSSFLPVPIPSKRDSTLNRGNLDVLALDDENSVVLCEQ